MNARSRWKPGVGLLLCLALRAGPLAAQGAGGIPVGSRAPVVKVNDLDGKSVDLGRWLGHRPVLMEFWATWCDNCEALLPRLKAAYQSYGDKVEFLAVNVTVNQTPDKVRRYVESHQVPFRLLYDDKGTSTRAYQAPATSFMVIVDRSGKVAYTGVGADQAFEPALERVAGALN
jgi:thiol-disulfide isomerase/thioredoxin